MIDYRAEYIRRIKLINLLHSDAKALAAAKIYYKHNTKAFINDFCVTYDPRKKGNDEPRLMPFVLFPIQEQYIDFLDGCLNDKESGIVDKSRDMGASYLACAFALHRWLFHSYTAIGFGSRKEEYVDKNGDMKAILPKIRQMISYIPTIMLPAGFSLKTCAPYMRILNPENGSSIIGEAGDNIGRGGRTTLFFKDESAFYERPELVEAALGDNTDVQIDISTHNGTNTIFYRKCQVAQIWTPNAQFEQNKTRKFILDWSDHPYKTQEWYEARRKKAEEEGLLHIFAQEVDRDPAATLDRIIIKQEWVKAAIDAHIKLGLQPKGEKVAGQDIADGGGDKNALIIRHGILLAYASQWAGEAGDAAKRSIPICSEYGVTNLQYDTISVGAGFRAEIKHMKIPPRMKIVAWNAGAAPQDPDKHIIPNDNSSATNADQYLNLKAQSWFRLRARFIKTYEAINHKIQFNQEDIISIDSKTPFLNEIVQQLSQATFDTTGSGKTIVEKRPNGALSPNLADAIVMCYNPIKSYDSINVFANVQFIP